MKFKVLITIFVFFAVAPCQEFIDNGFQKAISFLNIVKKKDVKKIKSAYAKGTERHITDDTLKMFIHEYDKIVKRFGGIDSSDWIYQESTLKGSAKMKIVIHNFIFQFPINSSDKKPPLYKVVVTYPERKTFAKISRFFIEELEQPKPKKEPAKPKKKGKENSNKKDKKPVKSIKTKSGKAKAESKSTKEK